jgi:DNA-binding sugar fermentation-stimulating protein
MRADFLCEHTDGSRTVVEVKTVVDSDYDPATTASRPGVFLGSTPYRRAAIFPWGNSKQKGPDGERVVSARAIKHVRELTAIAAGERLGDDGERFKACVLFVVVRPDIESFRPNAEACPSFARYLARAQRAGVRVLARRCIWGECFDGGDLPVDLSLADVVV